MGKIKERGQSLVELALGITILIYLLSGAVEFGLAFFQYVQLRDAAQEGALYGSITYPRTVQEIEQRARGASNSPVDLSDSGVTVQIITDGTDVESACESNTLEVRVTYPHKVFMPFMSKFIGKYINLTASVIDTVLIPTCP